MTGKTGETITTKIWREVPEPDNPFVARECYCSGFDVFGDLLGKISWVEYLYLLFKLEPPSSEQSRLLEGLSIVLANPGPRDHSVRAAMNVGVSGAPRAAALMAALGSGAGNFNGAREMYQAISCWEICGENLARWREYIENPPEIERADIWMPMEHMPGFDPHGQSCALPVVRALDYLTGISPGTALLWLRESRTNLESITKRPLSMLGVVAAGLMDLGMSAAQSEYLYLILRLPGAAAHALEQEQYGWRKYPFFREGLILKPMAGDPVEQVGETQLSDG